MPVTLGQRGACGGTYMKLGHHGYSAEHLYGTDVFRVGTNSGKGRCKYALLSWLSGALILFGGAQGQKCSLGG